MNLKVFENKNYLKEVEIIVSRISDKVFELEVIFGG